jgi:hypothetical protein
MGNFNESRVLAVLGMNKPKSNYERIELSYAQLKSLVLLELIDPNGAQNNSPSINDFLDFCEKYHCYGEDETVLEGYIITGDRPDKRISIEAIRLHTAVSSEKTKQAFINHFHHADEFEANDEQFRAWWD